MWLPGHKASHFNSKAKCATHRFLHPPCALILFWKSWPEDRIRIFPPLFFIHNTLLCLQVVSLPLSLSASFMCSVCLDSTVLYWWGAICRYFNERVQSLPRLAPAHPASCFMSADRSLVPWTNCNSIVLDCSWWQWFLFCSSTEPVNVLQHQTHWGCRAEQWLLSPAAVSGLAV